MIKAIIMLLVGMRLQNEILDEIKPNRLNSTWYGLPYIGKSYNRGKVDKEITKSYLNNKKQKGGIENGL